MSTRIAIAGLIVTALATSAFAGIRSTSNVTIDLTGRRAWGSLGTARNSADTRQGIGCQVVYSSPTWSYGNCYAWDANGVAASCYVSNGHPFINVMLALESDSSIRFGWEANGACSQLTVDAFSWTEPKKP